MMEKYGHPIRLARERFEAGEWQDALTAAEQASRVQKPSVEDGSDRIAAHVLSFTTPDATAGTAVLERDHLKGTK